MLTLHDPARPSCGIGSSPAGSVVALAPGQAEVTARSIRPGGIAPGTHSRKRGAALARRRSPRRVRLAAEQPREARTQQVVQAPTTAAAPARVDVGRDTDLTSRAPAARRRRCTRPHAASTPTLPDAARSAARIGADVLERARARDRASDGSCVQRPRRVRSGVPNHGP